MRTFSMALLTRELENNLKPECDSGGARCLCSERMMPTIRQTDFLALRQKPYCRSSRSRFLGICRIGSDASAHRRRGQDRRWNHHSGYRQREAF